MEAHLAYPSSIPNVSLRLLQDLYVTVVSRYAAKIVAIHSVQVPYNTWEYLSCQMEEFVILTDTV